MWKRLRDWFSSGNNVFSIVVTYIFSTVVIALIAYLCIAIARQPSEIYENALIALFGGLVGWLLGMFFAPYDAGDKDRLATAGQAFSAFVSGYIVSKADRFLEASLFASTAPLPGAWARLGLFVCSLLVIMLLVFSSRSYFDPDSRPGGTATKTPG